MDISRETTIDTIEPQYKYDNVNYVEDFNTDYLNDDLDDDLNSIIDVERELLEENESIAYDRKSLGIEEPSITHMSVLMPFINRIYSHVDIPMLVAHLPFLSTCLFMVPIIWVAIFYNYVPLPPLLIIVAVLTTVVSWMFWFQPKHFRNGCIHTMDAFMARITIAVFVLYNLITGGNLGFWISSSTMLVFFYLSNYFSSVEWCSDLHILTHVCAHTYAALGIFFTIKHALDSKITSETK